MSLSAPSKIRWRALPVRCAAVPAAGRAAAQTTLDGKACDGVFPARGRTRGDADIVSFRNGRFRSSACDKCGHADAPYRVAFSGGDTLEATALMP
jgi:hypothetical protein